MIPQHDRPILFSAPMIRALRAETKTQTRRILTPRTPLRDGVAYWAALQDGTWEPIGMAEGSKLEEAKGYPVPCPYGVPGDRLWVREAWGYRGTTWCSDRPTVHEVHIDYQADRERRSFTRAAGDYSGLPKQVCRCKSTGDEMERRLEHIDELQRFWRSWRPSIFLPRWASRITVQVTEIRVQRLQDITEQDAVAEGIGEPPFGTRTGSYSLLWDTLNRDRAPWHSNPWVWAVTFKPVATRSAQAPREQAAHV